MAFNFGGSSSTGGGFSFGQSSTTKRVGTATTVNTAATTTTLPVAEGFSFVQQSTAPPAAAAATTTLPVAGGFSFGQQSTAPPPPPPPAAAAATTTLPVTGGFSFGQPSTAPPAAAAVAATTTLPVAGSFSFGQQSTAPPPPGVTTATTGYSFVPVTTSKSSTLGFGSVAPSAPTGYGIGQPQQPSATTTTGLFTLGGLKTSSTNTLRDATKTSQTANNAAFGFQPASTTQVAITSITSFTTPSSSAFGAELKLGAASTSAAPSALPSTAFATTSQSALSGIGANVISTATVTPGKQMSYKGLEDTVEKWLHDLAEQEKAFLNQAAQVNVWDKQLIENGEKVTELHNEVERVKAEQQRLDRELDFILSQQEDLEELLQPLEQQFLSQRTQQHSQNADLERERTYRLAENIDSQLKRMMQDLRAVIEHINNSNVDPESSINQPMVQVAKILNAHMDSLQWVDQNTTQLQRRVDEVTQLMDSRKIEHEKTFHLTYNS